MKGPLNRWRLAAVGFLLSGVALSAAPKEPQRDWRAATVVEVLPPGQQKRAEPESLNPSATPIPRQSPFPIYTAAGGNTRWVFVFEVNDVTNDVTYVASTQAFRGDSFLHRLQPDGTVELARQGKRDLYVRVEGKKEEKLRLLDEVTAQPPDAAKDR
ncbi:MAG: hypothetical protein JNN08_03790 [Bryobacterales bacterium]|nr:hypothetical protein [Bryobacterales bacterium]